MKLERDCNKAASFPVGKRRRATTNAYHRCSAISVQSKVNVDSGNFLLGASRSTDFQTSARMSYLESTRGLTQWIRGWRALGPHLEESALPERPGAPTVSFHNCLWHKKTAPSPIKNKTKGEVPGKEHTPRGNTAPRQRKLQEQAAGAVPLPGCPSEGQTLQRPNSGQEISVLFCRFESVYEDNSEGCTPILSHQQSCLCEFRGLIIAPDPFSSVPMHKQNSKVMYTMGYSYSNGLWVVHAVPKT